jgi:hypothetical protein
MNWLAFSVGGLAMAVLIRTMDDIGLPRPDLGLGLALSWILGAFHRLGGGALHGSWMGPSST